MILVEKIEDDDFRGLAYEPIPRRKVRALATSSMRAA